MATDSSEETEVDERVVNGGSKKDRRGYGRYPNSLVVLLGLVAGGGGSSLYQVIDQARPDPFTGTEANKLETRILERIKDNRMDCRERIVNLAVHMEGMKEDIEDVAHQQDVVQSRLAVIEREMTLHHYAPQQGRKDKDVTR